MGRKGAAAGVGGWREGEEVRRQGRWRWSAAVGERERKEWGWGGERVGGGGKKEEAFGKSAERFVWGLICFAARALE